MTDLAQNPDDASRCIEVPDSIFDDDSDPKFWPGPVNPDAGKVIDITAAAQATAAAKPGGKAESNDDAESDRKKKGPTPELVYARLMRVDANTTIEGRTETGEVSTDIYRWEGSHWQHQQPEDLTACALDWLGTAFQNRATPATAESCVTAAGYLIHHSAPERSIAAMEARRGKRVVIATRDGYLEIDTDGGIRVIQPDRALGLTYAIATTLDPTRIKDGIYTPAPVPPTSMWGDWLRTFMPDPEVAALLQEAAAASIIPTCYEKVFLLLGSGANGKSTFLTALRAIHAGSATSLSLTHINDAFGLEPVIGKKLVTIAETPSFIGNDAEQTLKALVTRDAITINRKYRKAVTITPRAMIYVALNQPLHFTDQTYGGKRRYIYIPFPVKLTDAQKSNGYAERMVGNPDELRVFLDWLLEGAARLVRRGRFAELPQAVAAIEEQARCETDTVHGWAIDSGVAMTPMSPGTWCPRKEVYALYRQTTLDAGAKPVGDREFWRRLREEFPDLAEQRRRGERGERQYCASLYVPGLTHNAEEATRILACEAEAKARFTALTPSEQQAAIAKEEAAIKATFGL